MNENGMFVISLDFELNWGVHDVLTLDNYRENLLGSRRAIPRILELFKRYDIHATWATVGMLCFRSKDELLRQIPDRKPGYVIEGLSPYIKLNEVGESEEDDPLHFGLSLLEEVGGTVHQEVASHTFCHYYCLEEGQTVTEFESDLKASIKVKQMLGYTIRSLVFPRNQLNVDYLPVCKSLGIECFRGNEQSWLYKASTKKDKQSILKRGMRLLDCYWNLSGHHTYPLSQLDNHFLINIPSSRFLRPYSNRLKWLEKQRLTRIKESLSIAAKKREIFHLWWHPHNFGKNTDENLAFLTAILEHYSSLHKSDGIVSLNMGEVASLVQQ